MRSTIIFQTMALTPQWSGTLLDEQGRGCGGFCQVNETIRRKPRWHDSGPAGNEPLWQTSIEWGRRYKGGKSFGWNRQNWSATTSKPLAQKATWTYEIWRIISTNAIKVKIPPKSANLTSYEASWLCPTRPRMPSQDAHLPSWEIHGEDLNMKSRRSWSGLRHGQLPYW